MGWVDAVRACLSRYADGSGRAGRAEFWWFVGFVVVVVGLAGALGAWLGVGSPLPDQVWVVNGQIVTANQYFRPGWLQVVVALALTPPLVAVQVRRLHDRGRSGWWWWLHTLDLICGLGTLMLVFGVYIHPSQPQVNSYGVPAEPEPPE